MGDKEEIRLLVSPEFRKTLSSLEGGKPFSSVWGKVFEDLLMQGIHKAFRGSYIYRIFTDLESTDSPDKKDKGPVEGSESGEERDPRQDECDPFEA